MGRAIQAGRVWTNCYHAYPAHAAFGGYKESGIGRETHKVMLDHYQQTKNLLVSYSESKLGLLLTMVERVIATPAALELIELLKAKHGRTDVPPVRRLLRQQRRQLLPAGRAHDRRWRRVPWRDRRLPFYMGKSQYEYWQHTQLIIDVIDGHGGTFSLEGPEGKAFHTRSRVFTDAEMAELDAADRHHALSTTKRQHDAPDAERTK